MKILWICNVMLPAISNLLGIHAVPYGGWLTGAMNGLNKSERKIRLGVCCPFDNGKEVEKYSIDNIAYYNFPSRREYITDYSWYQPWFRSIFNDFKPDILHIFGTEFSHSLAAAKAFAKPDRTLVSIQGLCSEIAKYYFSQLPLHVSHGFNLRDVLRRDTLVVQRNSFISRGENEIKLLRAVGHVSGRTDWDKACTMQINPKLNYHFCNETLRESFYSDRWQLEKCEKHSIFASSCSYPIKGFHILLEAMPEILRRFPDAKIYVTGLNPYDIPIYKLPAYAKYLRRLINQNGLRETVNFCGTLDEQQMKDQYLKSNVFVLPSLIENSPNSLGEAMLLGVPCVAADVGGVSNLMTHGQDGLVYQHNAANMLAHYVCEIFENETLARTFSDNAAQHAETTYHPEVNAQKLMEIYETILEVDKNAERH